MNLDIAQLLLVMFAIVLVLIDGALADPQEPDLDNDEDPNE